MTTKLNNAIGRGNPTPGLRHQLALRLAAIVSIVAGFQAATQYLASLAPDATAVGSSIYHCYAPWAIVRWWYHSYEAYPEHFITAGSIGMLVTTTGLLGCAVLRRMVSHSSTINPYLHGSATWATRRDLVNAGLLAQNTGVYVGAWDDQHGQRHYLRHDGPEHVLTYAPTRSGKGVGLVLPTLLSWPHSAVITDLKGELWAMTAGWRQRYAHNKVIRFEPASRYHSARYNPLDEIRLATDNEVGDVQNLATLIVDPDGKGLVSHWQKTAQALLVGLILHVLYQGHQQGKAASIPDIDRLLTDPNKSIQEVLTTMAQFKHLNNATHPVVHAAARDMMDRPEEEAGSVLSTLKSYLSLYRDPVVANNVSTSDFHIHDLMNHDTPVSLYIITQPNDKARLQPLVRIMINLVVRLLADKMTFERVPIVPSCWQTLTARMHGRSPEQSSVQVKKAYHHRLLGMIDEFPSLGKLDILQESLAFVAGYGIKFYLICQDINQLKSRETGYGPDETITSNCHIQNAYPPNRVETAEHLSKLTGQTTIIKEQITTSGRRASMVLGQVSRTIQEVQRPLLTVDECLRMPGAKKNAAGYIEHAGDMVVYVAGYPAIYGKQPLYFQDPVFIARAAVPEPLETDRLRVPVTHPMIRL